MMLDRYEGLLAEDDVLMVLLWACFCFWDVRIQKVGERGKCSLCLIFLVLQKAL